MNSHQVVGSESCLRTGSTKYAIGTSAPTPSPWIMFRGRCSNGSQRSHHGGGDVRYGKRAGRVRDGYAVIAAPLEHCLCNDTLADMWQWIEIATHNRVKREDPSTWASSWPATSRGTKIKGFCSWTATQRARRVVHRWAVQVLFNKPNGPYVVSFGPCPRFPAGIDWRSAEM
jgi:hypothetical protein